MLIKNIFHKAINIGIDDKTEYSLIKNIRVTNALGFLVIGSHISAIIMAIYFIKYAKPVIYVCLLMIFFMSAALTLNYFKKHTFAIMIGALASINNITLFTILIGTKSNVHFLMPAVMIGAFYYFPYKKSKTMFGAIIVSLIAFIFLEIWFMNREPVLNFPESVQNVITVFVNLMFVVTTFGFMFYGYYIYRDAETNLQKEREKSEKLLLNILPDAIAERLKNDERKIADRYELVGVLFVDIVNFTKLSERISAYELVTILDDIFSEFDDLVEEFGVEKIKTIGDAYMLASGLGDNVCDPASSIADISLRMIDKSKEACRKHGHEELDLRIGINCGPVVAGVIGYKKFAYDLWGDIVNVASRMESNGIPGRIQTTEDLYVRLKDDYLFEERGMIEVKGKGIMKTYFLIGKKKN